MDVTGRRTFSTELSAVEDSLTMHGTWDPGLSSSVSDFFTSGLTGRIVGRVIGSAVEAFDMCADPILRFDLV